MSDDRTIRQPAAHALRPVVATPAREPMQTLADWRHVEVKDLPGTAPSVSMLLGPAIGEPVASLSEGFGQTGGGFGERAGSSDSRLNSGIAVLAGRWVIPTTRRIRGITQGGIQLPDGGDGGGSGAAGGGSEASGLVAPGATGNAAGTLIVSSDSRCDIVFFPGTDTGAELRLVLRGWKAGFSGPDDADSSEVPAALALKSGHYCVVTTDPDKRMQRAVTYPWKLPTGSTLRHPPDAIEVVVRLNAQITARGLTGKMKLLPVPTSG